MTGHFLAGLYLEIDTGQARGLGGAGAGAGDAAVPVLFLHPTPVDHAYWSPAIARLTRTRPTLRCVAPDLRGHGKSPLSPSGADSGMDGTPALTMAELAADIVNLLDALGIPQAVLVGSSIGGYVALELWRRIPDRILGLAFVCSKPQPDDPAALNRRRALVEKIAREGTSGLFDGMAKSLIGASARAARPGIVAEMRARMTLSPQAAIAAQLGLAARPDSLPTVEAITAPILAIAGGEDAACSPAEMQAFRAAPGGCEYHLLPDAGHFAAYEQPEKIAALLAGWLRQFVGR